MPRPLHNFANWFIDRLEAALPLVVLACVLVGLVGCAASPTESQRVQGHFAAAGNSIEQAKAFTLTAEDNVQATIPHADPVGKATLASASKAHDHVVEQLAITSKAYTDLKLDYDHLADAKKVVDDKNSALLDDYWSQKQRGQFRTLAIYAGLAIAAIVALKVFGGLNLAPGIVGVVGKIINGIYVFVVNAFTLFIPAIATKLRAGMEKVAADLHLAKTVATATAHANDTGTTVRMPVSATAHVTAVPQVVIGTQSAPIVP